MKAREYAIVLVTAPDLRTARKLARAALEARLAACANLITKVESHYWWQDKIDKGTEVLIIFKTSVHGLGPLEELIVAEHPYDTPEFIALRITRGNKRYLEWVKGSVS